jgi:hypothetical protein
LAILAIVVSQVPLGASTVSVQSANSNSGTHALRLEVSRDCVEGDLTLPDGILTTEPAQLPCGTLKAGDVDITAGSVHLAAGVAIELTDGFSVASGAELSTELGERVLGAAFLRDRSPAAETTYFVRYFMDPDDLTLNQAADRFEHLVAYDALGNREFVLGVTYNQAQGELRLWGEAYENDGTPRTTEGLCELVLGAGWQTIEAHWTASTGSDGDLVLVVDRQHAQSLAACLSLGGGLDNSAGEISSVEWGCRSPTRSGMGSLDLDDFDSRRQAPAASP